MVRREWRMCIAPVFPQPLKGIAEFWRRQKSLHSTRKHQWRRNTDRYSRCRKRQPWRQSSWLMFQRTRQVSRWRSLRYKGMYNCKLQKLCQEQHLLCWLWSLHNTASATAWIFRVSIVSRWWQSGWSWDLQPLRRNMLQWTWESEVWPDTSSAIADSPLQCSQSLSTWRRIGIRRHMPQTERLHSGCANTAGRISKWRGQRWKRDIISIRNPHGIRKIFPVWNDSKDWNWCRKGTWR